MDLLESSDDDELLEDLFEDEYKDLFEDEVVLDPVRPYNYTPRHGRYDGFADYLIALKNTASLGVKVGFKRLLEHDLVLAASSGLVVMGLIFNVFSFALYGFRVDPQLAFILSCLGIATWMFALALFMFFLARPEPKHGRRR